MRIAAALLGISLLGACATDAPDETFEWGGDGKADGASSAVPLIQTNSPFYWADSDYESFRASEASLGYPLQTPIADSDALTARLQGWVDRIDAVVRAEVERNIGEPLVAPKPIVKVLPSGNTLNAWVSPALTCAGALAAGATEGTPSKTLLLRDYAEHGTSYSACVRPTYPETSELVAFWNRAKPACTLGDDLSISGTGCEIQTYGAPGELTFMSTSPYIHVSTDLIALASEQTLVVILAHELGHYYRAHVSDAALQRYNFWYETEVDRKKIPVPSTTAAQLEAAYAEIEKGPQAVQSARPGRYSARMRGWILTSIAPLLAERTEPDFVCAKARDLLGPWSTELLAGYGMPTDAITSYLAFETELAACAPKLDMGSGGTATSLSYGTVLMSVPAAKLPSTWFPFYATMADILGNLDVKAKDLDAKEAALLKRVRDNRIGLYTVEQEADNIALALATKLGISGDQVIGSWLEFITGIADAVPESYKTQYKSEVAACKAQLDAGFTTVDADGHRTPTFIPIGDLSEPHHSDCYRLFNFWREQKQKKYAVETPVTFEPGWDELRAHAQQLSDEAKSNGF